MNKKTSKTMTEKISFWLVTARAFSFPASFVPVVVGGVFAFVQPSNEDIAWYLLPLVIVCSFLFHAATNLLNDYYDYRNDVDTLEKNARPRVLVAGIIKPSTILKVGVACFSLGFTLGLILVLERGIAMLALGVAGLLGGYFYTGGPKGYKYLALGEVFVFILMGPLMVIGTYFALTGSFSFTTIPLSLPVGFLVIAILHANNFRDIEQDKTAGITTLAIKVGFHNSKIFYYSLLGFGCMGVLPLIFLGYIGFTALLFLLTIPIVLKNIGKVRSSSPQHQQPLETLVHSTAMLHLQFGVILSVAMFVEHQLF